MPHTSKEWIESFQIFEKYEATDGLIAADHDEVWAGPDPVKVSPEDTERLEKLGWLPWDTGNFHAFV